MSETDQPETIGEQVRTARVRRHMTQKQLAEAAGVSENTVIAIEKGRNSQQLSLSSVMDVLDIEPSSEVAERAGWPPDVHYMLEIIGMSLMDMPPQERARATSRILRAMFTSE